MNDEKEVSLSGGFKVISKDWKGSTSGGSHIEGRIKCAGKKDLFFKEKN
ncbi:MAG: hypothetical protein HN576_13250 [Bacteriovoracaceae bacterium]|jgi:hypothetical protein|nr:hypothetical protein [Bacteriovoracaceae bacterium]